MFMGIRCSSQVPLEKHLFALAAPCHLLRPNTMRPKPEATTPADFPRDHEHGAVSGVQPKLVIRKVGEVFVNGSTAERLCARYDMCFDLVNQLTEYCNRKMKERPEWSTSEQCEKVQTTLKSRSDWDLSEGEVQWVMGQMSRRMS